MSIRTILTNYANQAATHSISFDVLQVTGVSRKGVKGTRFSIRAFFHTKETYWKSCQFQTLEEALKFLHVTADALQSYPINFDQYDSASGSKIWFAYDPRKPTLSEVTVVEPHPAEVEVAEKEANGKQDNAFVSAFIADDYRF